jgi:anti-sigma factor RsiW
MNEQWEETLSALADGEDADADVVEVALSMPESRAFLADMLRLRRLVQQDLEPPRVVATPASERVAARRWMRVAATVVLTTLAGFGVADIAGRLGAKRPAEGPPTPTRVLRFEPGVDWHPVRIEGAER